MKTVPVLQVCSPGAYMEGDIPGHTGPFLPLSPAAPLPHHDVCLKDLHIAVHCLAERHEGVFRGQLEREQV